jgi:hypothetical protein
LASWKPFSIETLKSSLFKSTTEWMKNESESESGQTSRDLGWNLFQPPTQFGWKIEFHHLAHFFIFYFKDRRLSKTLGEIMKFIPSESHEFC